MPINEESIESYGQPIIVYSGDQGTIQIYNQNFDGEYIVGQFPDGKIILIINIFLKPNQSFITPISTKNTSFIGQTEDGNKIESSNILAEINNITENASNPFCRVFSLNELIITINEDCIPTEIKATISNYLFKGNAPKDDKLVISNDCFNPIIIQKIKEYPLNESTIQALHNILPTTEVIFRLNNDKDLIYHEIFLTYLCLILSVSRGTEIQWINYELLDESKNKTKIIHQQRINRPYTSSIYAPINKDLFDSYEDVKFIKAAITNFPNFLDNQSTLLSLVNIFLKTKSNDFIQIKGHAIAIVFEMIKQYALNSPYVPIEDKIINTESISNDISKDIKKLIKNKLPGRINSEIREKLYENIAGINRISFKRILQSLLDELELIISEDELNSIIKSRNQLVHTGNYYCAILAREENRIPTIEEYRNEYEMLLRTLDKIFIQLLLKYK